MRQENLEQASPEENAVEDLKLLTVKEASAATRLSKSTVYQLLYKGIIRRVRLPHCNKVLIQEAELLRYVNEGLAAGSAN